MEVRGRQSEAPRSGLPRRTPSRFDVVFWIAFAVSFVLVVGQVAFVMSFTPIVLNVAEKSGQVVPAALRFAGDLGPFGLFALLSLCDAVTFATFVWFARRYWVGLLFVPSILYLAGAFGALWIYIAQVATVR